jgi:hypothetical protein
MPTSKLRDPISKSKNDSKQDSGPVVYTFSPIFDAASKIVNDINEEEQLAKQNAQNLENLENNSNEADDQFMSTQEREESAEKPKSADWVDNTSGKQQDQTKPNGRFSFVKKKGPLTAIILTIVGGGFGIGGLLSPSLLLVNLKETMVNKFNVQLTSMDIRTKKITISKMTGGMCSSAIKIGCKYSSMSEKQIKRLENAGIKISYDEDTDLLGRHKVTGIDYKDNPIKAEDLANKLDTDPDFRLAVKKGYNPLFAGFYDKVWNKSLFYIDKKGVHLGGKDSTDAEKLAQIQEDVKESSNTKNSKVAVDGDIKDGEGNAIDTATEAGDTITGLADDLQDGITEAAESGTQAAKQATNIADKVADGAVDAVGSVNSVLSLTGWVDNACTIYGTLKAVGYAAKAVRAVQLVSYAMTFLKIADMIKSGANPSSEDIAYLGTVLTTAIVSTKVVNGIKQTTSKTATDSFGYKYASTGEIGKMSPSTAQFMTGAGLPAESYNTLMSFINSILGNTKTAKGTCRVTQNILFQLGSMAVSIGIMLIPVAGEAAAVSISVSDVVKAAAGAAAMIIASMLPGMLKDIVAGVVVDGDTVGEAAGDAITAGSSNMMGTLAKTGGNSPLSVEQAVAYSNLSKQVAQEYAEEDRIAYSPLDATNSNTFMGSLVSKILPYFTNVSSVSSALSSISSFTTSSIASINNTSTKATTAEEYSLCKDSDYEDIGVAADPYCNIAYGIPTEDLNIDPTEVMTTLINAGQIDGDGNITGQDFKDFQANCIYRTEPIGYSGSDFQANDGKQCMVDGGNANAKYYYLYTIDTRIDDGMSGDDEDLEVALSKGLDSKVAFYDGSDGINNTTASNSFFAKIKDFFTNLFSKSSEESSYNNQIPSKVTVI